MKNNTQEDSMLQSETITKYRFPFSPFPNGWFRVAGSDEIHPGEVKPIYYFGKDLVLFRTEEGKAHVFDAYCPHIGAHLGHGGKVKGETIQCPFHGWCYDGNGQCSEIPYSSKIPPNAQIQAWPVREINGMIWVYHHADKEAPHWEIPKFPECYSEEWVPLSLVYQWKIRTHVQEIPENLVDSAHFAHVHHQYGGAGEVEDFKPGDTIFRAFVKIPFTYSHLQFLSIKIFGEELQATGTFDFYAMGFGTLRGLTKPVEYNLFMLHTCTPIDDEHIELTVLFSMKPFINRFVTNILVKSNLRRFKAVIEEDIDLWEKKMYHTHPLLCQGDGPIKPLRNWAAKFYSKQE